MTENRYVVRQESGSAAIGIRKNAKDNAEFYKSYSTKAEEWPMWWTCDTPLNLTQSGRKREFKRMQQYNRHLLYKLNQQEQLLTRYKQDMQAEIGRTTQAILNNSDILAEKMQELDTISRIEYVENEHKLLQAKMQCEVAELNLELSKLQVANQEVLQEKQQQLLNKENTFDSKLLEYNKRLASVSAELSEVNKNLYKLKTINLQNAEINPTLPTARDASLIADRVTSIDYKALFKKDFVLSITDLTFKEKGADTSIFSNLNIDIKKNKVTVLYSPQQHNLQSIKHLIAGDYANKFVVSAGDICVGAKSVVAMEEKERAAFCAKKTICVTQIVSNIKFRLRKTVCEIYEDVIKKASLTLSINSLGLHPDILDARIDTLSEQDIYKLAVAVLISFNDKILYVNEAELNIDCNFIAKFCSVLQSIKDKTIIFMTANLNSVATLSKSEVYRV
ncbi:MAG: hypothetical protein R3Y23_00645 [Bacillota bacterium]